MTIIYLVSFMMSCVGILLSVAFFTLMERKIMGLMHYRKGPNKIIGWGLSQPISDALKLMSKQLLKFSFSKYHMFFIGPQFALMLMIMCWQWFFFSFQSISKSGINLFIIFAIMSMSAYIFIFTGWGSNSKFSLLGSYRAISQIISYEVCLILLILGWVFICQSYKFSIMSFSQQNMWMMWVNLPLFLSWMLICLAETNRTPFDHAESESELVSGFNVEYGGSMFALIFIAEYGMIMFMSFLTTLIFLGSCNFIVKIFIMSFIFVWVRSSLPRLRYDKLMMISWKVCLPYSLCLIMTHLSI